MPMLSDCGYGLKRPFYDASRAKKGAAPQDNGFLE